MRRYSARLPRPRRGWVGTAAKLVVASVLVGLVMGYLGLSPIEVWAGLWRAASDGVVQALNWGTGWVAVLFAAMATGAVIVVPIWLIRRMLTSRS